jgi:hypothetical protein
VATQHGRGSLENTASTPACAKAPVPTRSMRSTLSALIGLLAAARLWIFLLATGCPLLLDDSFSTLSPEEAAGGSAGNSSGSAQSGASNGISADASDEGLAGIAGSAGHGSIEDDPNSDGSSGGGSSPGAPSGGGTSSSGGASGAGGSSSGAPSDPATCAAGAALGANGHCYVVRTTSSSWVGARSDCRNLGDGWDLATVLGHRDAAFLSRILTTEAWIGANDASGTGVWRWVNDGAQFWQGNSSGNPLNGAYVNWNSGEPNGDGARCLRILPSTLWATADCGSGSPAVCEGPTD